jgi:hypothetical protein
LAFQIRAASCVQVVINQLCSGGSWKSGFTPAGGQQFTILTASSIVNNGFVLTGSAASSFNLLVNRTSPILQAAVLRRARRRVTRSADYAEPNETERYQHHRNGLRNRRDA